MSVSLLALLALPLYAAAPGAPRPASLPAQTFVVTSGADTDDNTCDAAHCTLREAINHANFFAGADRITFAIPTSQPGQQVAIVLTSALPPLTEAVEIDGFTQPGAVAPGAAGTGGTWLVNVVPASTSITIGLDVRTSGVRIAGLSIKSFGFGVSVGYQDPGTGVNVAANDNVVTQNLLGMGPTTAACGTGNTTGNRSAAVLVRYGARRTVVSKNYIGCNATGVLVGVSTAHATTVTENFIGARPGQGGFPVALGNTGSGVEVTGGARQSTISLNLIMHNASGVSVLGGDSTDVSRNNFAANTASGVRVFSASAFTTNLHVRVRGNGFGLFDPLPGFTSSASAAGRNGRGVLIENASDVVVGGTTAADRNVLAYSTGPGVEITGATAFNNRVIGNYIGTGPAGEGNVNAGNQGGGVVVRSAPDNRIGGSAAGEGNVIADNEPEFPPTRTHGIAVIGASRTIIQGNRIGVSASGASEGQGNYGYGIYLERAVETRIGQVGADPEAARNEIANNRFGGIQIGASAAESGTSTNDNTVGFNRIYRNGDNAGTGLGIDLGGDGVTANDPGDADGGPNFLTNAPQITGVTLGSGGAVVTGTMPAEPSATYTLRFFASDAADPSGMGEGQTPVGTPVTAQASSGGVLTFTSPALPGVVAGQYLTATASDAAGQTGEFGNAFRVRAAGELVVNAAADTDDGACAAAGTGNGCTLREAINEAERNADENTISFELPAATTAITLASVLPVITRPVRIDGFSQNGAVRPDAAGRGGAPVVTIIGAALPAGSHGLRLRGTGAHVIGLRLLRFSGAAVDIAGTAATGNFVVGSYLGTTPTSTTCTEGHGNGTGVQISGGATGNNVGLLPIFGLTPVPNVLGCNGTAVRIDGAPGNGVLFNLIGTNAGAGGALLALPNSNGVIVSGAASTGNYVLGNDLLSGIRLVTGASGTGVAGNSMGTNGISLDEAPGTTIAGNSIGRARFPLARSGTGYVDAPVSSNGIFVQRSANVVIGGDTADERNLIAGVEGEGIDVVGAQNPGLRIVGNYIGTDETGNAGPGVLRNGIAIEGATGVQIGGQQPGEGNVIVKAGQGRTTGFDLTTSAGLLLLGAHGAVVEGNLIGVGTDGAVLGGKNAGILVVSSTGVRIGGAATPTTRNVVMHNAGPGIQIGLSASEAVTRGVTVAQNWIDANGGLGVDLGGDGVTANDPGDRDTGPNGLANAPIIQYAFAEAGGIKVTGTFDGRPAASGTTGRLYTLQAFVSGGDGSTPDEGLLPVGAPFTARADARTGRVSFSSPPLAGLSADARVTLLATDDEGNTSEFSAGRRVGTETARIQVTHGIAGASTVNIDVYITREPESSNTRIPVASNLAYLKASASFAEVEAGRYVVDAYVAGTNTLIYTNRTRSNFEVSAGDLRMVFIGDPEGAPIGTDTPPVFVAPKYVALAPRGGAFAGDGARAGVEVFVVHGVPDGPPLTVVVQETGQVLAQNLALGQAGDLVTLETGPATLEIRRASDNVVLRTARFDFSAAEGSALPVLIAGFLSPPPGRTVPPVEVRAVEGGAFVAADGGPALPEALTFGVTPNPARGATHVRYALPGAARVRLSVFDALGREVAVLMDADAGAGEHAVPLSTDGLAPGVYVLRLATGTEVRTARLVVAR